MWHCCKAIHYYQYVQNRTIGAFRGKAPHFKRGGGVVMKDPQLRSEKNMTTYLAYELDKIDFLFILTYVIAGFQPVLYIS